jgi:signal peptidase II
MIRRLPRPHLLAMAVALACFVGCDQATKQLAISRLQGQRPQSFFGDVLRLQYAENSGAFLGLGGNMPTAARWCLLVAMNGALTATIVVVLLARRPRSILAFAAWVLLAAGALGNLIDRIRFDGIVVDFLNLGVGSVRTGIFNVADIAISLGAALLLLQGCLHSGESGRRQTALEPHEP